MLIKKIVKFFDKLEDRVRGKLNRYPILYAFLGGIGMVLFWRGVWYVADDINTSGIISIIIGSVILLMTGLLVYVFTGKRTTVSSLVDEKKLVEKVKDEIETEESKLKNLQNTLDRLEKKLDHIDKDIEER